MYDKLIIQFFILHSLILTLFKIFRSKKCSPAARPLNIIFVIYYFCVPSPLCKFIATGLVIIRINIQEYNLLITRFTFLFLIFSLVSGFNRKHRPMIVINIILYFNKLTDICFIFKITGRGKVGVPLSPSPPHLILRLSAS